MKFSKLAFQMRRNQFIGLGILGVLILIFQLGFSWYKGKNQGQFVKIEQVDNSLENIELEMFNPNDLEVEDWRKLGFTERQVQIILKYKEVVGGAFVSKEQLAKCYAISEEKFAELSPYINLPEKAKNKAFENDFEKKELKIFGKFNPDDYTAEDWEKLGFSAKQATAIVKYKNYLGESFGSKAKFKECFVISEENYRKLAPYLLLPEQSPQENLAQKQEKSKIQYMPFDPNELDLLGWQRLGFSEKQAQVILNYKERNLKGRFRNLEQIEQCFVISAEKFAEMKLWIRIESKEVEVKSQGGEVKNQKTDFSKIDLNIIDYKQLLEFGFDEKGARSFLGFRKKLGGFVHKNQVLETYNLDKELARKLIATALLDGQKVSKHTLKTAPEDFLKNHPYFRKYGEKIIFYRITFSSDKEIFEKIKATPDEVAKMKMYLR